MINLIPDEGMRQRQMIYHHRLLAVWLFCALAILFLSAVFLIPTIFVLRSKFEAVKGDLAVARGRPISNQADAAAELIRSANLKLKILNSQTKAKTFGSIIKEILDQKTSVITLGSVEQDGKGILVIRGLAKSRSSLLSFVKSLESSASFGKVESPISNLISNVDIDFSISLAISTSTNKNGKN